MGLLEIKKYMMQVKVASLATLCAHFNCESDLLRSMLCHWIQKGCLRQGMKKPGCGKTCSQCALPEVEIYEWVVL